jgi:hypothetical protein
MEDGTEHYQWTWWGVFWACQQTGMSVAAVVVRLLQGQFQILVPWSRYRSSVTDAE